MAKRVFTSAGLTFTASAAGSAATGSAYMAMRGATSTQLIEVLEISFSGKTGTSTVIGLVLKRASTLATTPTTLAAPHSDGFMFPNASALSSSVICFVTASVQTVPSNTVTDATLQLGLNGFGGIYRWNAAPTQQWFIVGNAATTGESVLFNSSSHGGVTCAGDGHILYEPA